MELVECEHKETEWVPYFPGAADEPPSGPGYRCLACGEFLQPEDEATVMGL